MNDIERAKDKLKAAEHLIQTAEKIIRESSVDRDYEKWSTFEIEFLDQRLEELAHNLAIMYGRSEKAIMFAISRSTRIKRLYERKRG
jgi:hypothetical protein